MSLQLHLGRHRRRAFASVVVASLALTAQGQGMRPALVSNGGSPFFDVNAFLGANTFYSHGYTGQGVIAANIEGGIAANVNPMLTKISKTFYGEGALTGGAAIQGHATACTSMIAGYDASNPSAAISTGIAYGAGLWTGNIATAYGGGGSFYVTTNSSFTAYYRALVSGIDGQTADITSSSYIDAYGDVPTQRLIASGLPLIDADDLNSDYLAVALDSIVARSHKLVVLAAGNNGGSGADLRTVGAPASGNNGFVVGASGDANLYNGRAWFSAYGPNPYNQATGLQTGNVLSNVNRARVDILAPGISITGATTGSGFTTGSGTSFATPIVAGGAALVESAGKSLGYANATDNRVVIAILQNSADQLAGWDNATHLATVDGFSNVSFTDQALDFQQGAGQMNLDRAYTQLTSGTHDVLGDGGGLVTATGWDLGALAVGGHNDYTMSLLGGTVFSSTLRFNGGATFGTLSGDNVDRDQLGFTYLSDFSIQLFEGVGATATLVAESDAKYITSEHFVFNLASSGMYTLRVNYLGDNYNFVGDHGAIGYGLAWSGVQSVPEPASLAALGLGAIGFLRLRRRAH